MAWPQCLSRLLAICCARVLLAPIRYIRGVRPGGCFVSRWYRFVSCQHGFVLDPPIDGVYPPNLNPYSKPYYSSVGDEVSDFSLAPCRIVGKRCDLEGAVQEA